MSNSRGFHFEFMIQPGEGGENGNKGIIDAIWLRINARSRAIFGRLRDFLTRSRNCCWNFAATILFMVERSGAKTAR